MRYFLFTIYIKETVEKYKRSNIAMTYTRFPSIKDITGLTKHDNIIIESVFEFKSKEDYESFIIKS